MNAGGKTLDLIRLHAARHERFEQADRLLVASAAGFDRLTRQRVKLFHARYPAFLIALRVADVRQTGEALFTGDRLLHRPGRHIPARHESGPDVARGAHSAAHF